MIPDLSKHVLTFGHLDESGVVLGRILVFLERRVFDEARLLGGALLRPPRPGQGQGAGQKPERDGSQQGDDPCDEVAQPPGPHPASVCWGDGDALCVGGGQMMRFKSVPTSYRECFIHISAAHWPFLNTPINLRLAKTRNYGEFCYYVFAIATLADTKSWTGHSWLLHKTEGPFCNLS